MHKVVELMTPAPFTTSRNDVIGTVRDAMLDIGIHCIPVSDDDGRPVGILTSWDMVEEYAPQESVENAMTAKVITVGPHETTHEAAELMRTNFVHHLVVVDEVGEVAGVVSSLDLLSEVTDA